MFGYKGLIIRSLESPVDSWVKGNTAVRCDLLTGCLLPWCHTVDDLHAPASALRLVHPAPPSDPSQDCRSVKAQNCTVKDHVAAHPQYHCTQIKVIHWPMFDFIAFVYATDLHVQYHLCILWHPRCVPSACNKCKLHVHQSAQEHMCHRNITNMQQFNKCVYSNVFCCSLHALILLLL